MGAEQQSQDLFFVLINAGLDGFYYAEIVRRSEQHGECRLDKNLESKIVMPAQKRLEKRVD